MRRSPGDLAPPRSRRPAAAPAGAPAVSGSRPGTDSGYVLFGVLIGVSLLGVGMLAAVTLWSQVLQREREAELVFRGEAIARAIQRYQETRPGTLPETLEELVEGRHLRRAWLDPMTNRPFRLLRVGGRVVTATGGAPAPDPDESEGPDPRAGANPPGEPTPGPGSRQTAGPEPEGPAATGIIGVASTSDALALRPYRGARRYRDWRFEAEVREPAADPTAPAPERGR